MNVAEQTRHIPVLCAEVVAALSHCSSGRVLDCTLGGGGHTRALLDSFPELHVVACDRDEQAIKRASAWSSRYGNRLTVCHGAFSELGDLFTTPQFHGVVADLGMSTDQLWEERGFSFSDTGPLDMRMDTRLPVTGAELLGTLSEAEIGRVLAEGGVGPERRAIARAIVRARQQGAPVRSAAGLSALVEESFPRSLRKGTAHPATVVFQALRIAVNRELDELRSLLSVIPALILKGGRVVVISFHSLEDRMVTRALREWGREAEFSALQPAALSDRSRKALGKLLTKKAVRPSEEEVTRNSASRSALLRIFEFSNL